MQRNITKHCHALLYATDATGVVEKLSKAEQKREETFQSSAQDFHHIL